VPVTIDKRFVANDAMTEFTGGVVARHGAARGHFARKLGLFERFLLTQLSGLRPGHYYTITFAVKPLAGKATSGLVGDPTGLRWGQAYWTTSPARRWHYFRETLRATQGVESLALMSTAGSQFVLFDAVRVREGRVRARQATPPPAVTPPPAPPSGQPSHPAPQPPPSVTPTPPAPPQPPTPVLPKPTKENPLAHEFGSVFGGGTSSSARNVQWRLSIWKFMLEKTAHDPVFGVGFGRPTDFHWNGNVYDARTGPPSDINYSTGPHNSFVNLIYRTGALGFLSLLALVVLAAIRLVRALRTPLRPFERSMLVGTAVAFVMATGTACFSVALEGPYMGMIFWIFLGLMLVLPKLLSPSAPAR
jgi:hypothetical protein